MQLIFVALISTSLYSQDIKGQWNGTLQVQGIQLRIIFHVDKIENEYKTTLDSPDQNANGIPVTVTYFNSPNVKFEIPNIGMVYEGTLADNTVTGKWMQSDQTFPVVLTKTEILPKKDGQ